MQALLKKAGNVRCWAIWIAVVTAIVYAPSVVSNHFVGFDDDLLILANPTAQGLSLRHIINAFTTFDPELYVPLTMLSYQIEWTFFGANPFIFHLTNLLLHLGSVVLVLAIVTRIAGWFLEGDASRVVAIVCAAIFALHPLNTEAVAWAAARKDVLAGLLGLLTMWLYVRYREEDNRTIYFLSIATFALSLMAKVSIVLLPVALASLEFLRGRPMSSKRLLPHVALSLLFGAVAIMGKADLPQTLTLWERKLLSFRSIALLLQKFILPLRLSIFYPHRAEIVLMQMEFLFPAILVVLLLTLAIATHKRRPLVSFGILFFFLMIAPTFGGFLKNGFLYVTSDRYAYLPMIGLLIAIISTIVPWALHAARGIRAPAMGTIGIVIVATLATLTFLQSRIWADGETLFAHAAKLDPQSAHALNNLATEQYRSGKLSEALATYQRAIEANPDVPQIYANAGLVLAKLGRIAEAKEMFTRGMQASASPRGFMEQDLDPYIHLANLNEGLGLHDEALATLHAAVARAPQSARAHYYLGVFLQKRERTEEAIEELRRAIELDPRHLAARYHIAGLAAEKGDLETAHEHLQFIVRRDPDFENAARHLDAIEKMLMNSELRIEN